MPSSEDADERHLLANQWTQRGITLLSSDDATALPEALSCFDTAIDLRRDLPLDAQPWYRWGLSAGWMNRGEVLSRLGRQTEALESYEHALEHLARLPFDLDPAVRWRLGLAWMNRGLLLQTLGKDHLLAAMESLAKAISVLSDSQATTMRERGTLGCAWINQAAMLMDLEPPRALAAQESALRGLGLLPELEQRDPVAAEAGLTARHRYCQATSWLLETPPVDAAAAEGWIMTASDCVEDGLSLYLKWRPQLQRPWDDLALQLFRFGCRIYLAYQPQFLGEFMLDILKPKAGLPLPAAFYDAAVEATRTAARILRHRGPTQLGPGRVDDVLHLLSRLEAAAGQILERRDQQETTGK